MTKVAIMGYGVVGSGLIELIDKNRENNGKNEIIITSILVRDKEKHISSSHSEVITTNVEEFFSIENDVVIEVMGGLHPAYDYVKRALTLGKHVITANKDLIATFGYELFKLAKENNVFIMEALWTLFLPAIKKAKKWIEDLTKDVVVGETYVGKVTRLMAFGAFVEVLPGKEGLVHISQLAKERVEKVEDVVNVGDEIMVKCIEIDEKGRINLSRKALLGGGDGPAHHGNNHGGHGNRPRRDDHKR